MTQLCCSSDTYHLLLSLLYDHLFSFVSFLTSHPLHLAYFFFFFPRLFPLISFLFPLILSTSIILVLFLHSKHDGHEDNAVGLLDQLGSVVVALIGNVFEWEFEAMVELYKENGEDPVEIFLDSYETELLECSFESVCRVKEDPVVISLDNSETSKDSKNPCLERTEQLSLESSTKNKILEHNSDPVTSKGDLLDTGNHLTVSTALTSSPSMRSTYSLQRDGSMRKEKEWKRTLACKLYEERMTFKLCEDRTVVEGAEEMDLLWEAYEADAGNDDKSEENIGKKEKHVEEEDEEELEEGSVQLCCLQALRLSTGKMNLGVRRPSLQKISKVFKGIGFFHRSGRRSRKG